MRMKPTVAERAPLLSVALISAAALAYEILLTRIFALVHWHHLVATTISLALLGYGVSGSFLALAGERLRRGFRAAFITNALLFAVTGPLCVLLAQRFSFDPQALAWGPRPLASLALSYLLLALPFFAAANCVGLALWRFPDQIPRLYGLDLLGAGAGAIALLPVLSLLPLGKALLVIGLGGSIAALAAAAKFAGWRSAALIAVISLGATSALWDRVEIRPSAYKDLSRALTALGARIEYREHGVSGQLTVLRNDQVPLRSAPGLSLLARDLPPRQWAVFIDGDARGTLLRPEPGKTPGFLRELSSALPYALLEHPSVLVLDAGSGLAVEQALLQDAARVLAVESNPLLVDLVCGRGAFTAPDGSRDTATRLCRHERVTWRTGNPRALLAERPRRFDLITLSVAAERAGLNSQHEDFTLTVEAFAEYLAHLSDRGLLAIDGQSRLPPRLALRMVATAHAALRKTGVRNPAEHLAMIRGWQRFSLVVSHRPLGKPERRNVRDFAESLGFDLVWLSDLGAQEVNRYQQLAEPWFFNGVRARLTEPKPENPDGERFRLDPATDDRPFPYRFSRWQALRTWLSPAQPGAVTIDLGLLLGVASLAFAVLASTVLILSPLVFRPRQAGTAQTGHWRWRTLAYFGLIGLAFLFIEIAWIHRLQRFLGQPVYATALALAGFLVFAGFGSVWAQRRPPARRAGLLTPVVLAIAALSLIYLVWLDGWLTGLATLPLFARGLAMLVLLAPLAFAMGIPFPLGLQRLDREAAPLVPWAWGINGCASVISAVAAPLLAMEIGFSGLILIGVAAYLLLLGVLPAEDD